MKTEDIQALAAEAAKTSSLNKTYKSSKILTKMTLEAALNAELDEYLGYDKHETSSVSNSRNDYSSKTIQTEDGQFELKTPRDRNNDFEPALIKKKQRCFVSMSDKILFLYAQGMTTRGIFTAFKDLYDADVSATLISKVTDAVIEQVVE